MGSSITNNTVGTNPAVHLTEEQAKVQSGAINQADLLQKMRDQGVPIDSMPADQQQKVLDSARQQMQNQTSDEASSANPYQSQQFAQALQQSGQNTAQSQANTGNLTQQEFGLADALKKQAAGQGPNPALEQLKMTTDQNNQAAASQIASQRGLNPALAARMASQGSTMANQNAAGQAAVMGANQQLAAQNQLGQLYGNIGNQQLGQTGQNLSQQQILQNALAQQNQQYVQGSLGSQGLTSQAAGQNAQIMGGLIGGGLNAVGGALGSYAGKSQGGYIHGGTVHEEGDSEKNDTVPAMLSPGEIVIPRTKAKDPDKAKEFIDKLLGSASHDDGEGFGKVLQKKRKLKELG